MIPQLYEPFKHWAEKGSVYILSDLHLGDSDCKLMDPNWITPEEQIKIINDIARKNDTFICLGDVGDPKYLENLKAGHKVLIMGNHDRKRPYEPYFDEIYSGPLFIGDRLLLSHEPISLPFAVNIHGHDHGNEFVFDWNCHHLNLAANVCGYRPINLGKEIERGLLADIQTIHRMTIDDANKRKQERNLETRKNANECCDRETTMRALDAIRKLRG